MRLPVLAVVLALLVAAPAAEARFRVESENGANCAFDALIRWTPPPDLRLVRNPNGGWRYALRAGPPAAQGVRGLVVELGHRGRQCHPRDLGSRQVDVGFLAAPGAKIAARLASRQHRMVPTDEWVLGGHVDDYLVVLIPGATAAHDSAVFLEARHRANRFLYFVRAWLPPYLSVSSARAWPSHVNVRTGRVRQGTPVDVPVEPGPGGTTRLRGDLHVPEEPSWLLSNFTIGVSGSPETVTTGAFLGSWEGRERVWELPLGPMTALMGDEVEPGVFEVGVPFLRPAEGEGDLYVFVDLTLWRALDGSHEEGQEIDVVAGRSDALPGVFVASTEALPLGPTEVSGEPWDGRVRVQGTVWNRVVAAGEEAAATDRSRTLRAWLVTLALVALMAGFAVRALRA